jgi:hypothetical protein
MLNMLVCHTASMQAERLSWHPSILTWCGNNELELSYEWANNTFIRSNRNMFVNDYMTNIRTLRRAIKKVRELCAIWQGTVVGDCHKALYQFSSTATTGFTPVADIATGFTPVADIALSAAAAAGQAVPPTDLAPT